MSQPLSSRLSPAQSLHPEEVLEFTRALARGLAGGHSLLACLRAMPEHTARPAWAGLLQDCACQSEAGSMLSEALARHPETFDVFYLTMVRAGELHDKPAHAAGGRLGCARSGHVPLGGRPLAATADDSPDRADWRDRPVANLSMVRPAQSLCLMTEKLLESAED